MSGFRNVVGGILAYLSWPLNDIKSVSHNNLYYHINQLGMDSVYITDGTGRNINNNNKSSISWNNYLIPSKFKSFSEALNHLCYSADGNSENRGIIHYIPHSADGSDPFNGTFAGGYSYSSTADHVFKFTPLISYDNNVVLNLVCFVPALLSLENGNLLETYA